MNQIESFGKYLLLERLAAGGMAEVYLAKSSGVSGVAKFLAVKRILPQYSDNPEFIDMFKDEAKIAIHLSHGNVVSIYEFGVEARQFYLVMEYVEGQNLRQILNHLKKEGKEFSIDQVIYVIKQVAAGLDHAHRCLDGATGKPLNITHRDMSPQNIMISFEGEVKIVDFGIAKAESQMEQTRAGTIKGKFGYMSPEQAEGHLVDSRTDIFSLGIILWELLAKDRLFTANSEAATLRKIRECQIPPLRRINPAIPGELERICNKALSKELSLRYQSAADLHRDLNRFLNTQYPEFSPQDFSFFMKNSFADMFLENRKKQVEYAKAKPPLVAEKTSITQTETDTDLYESDNSIRANDPPTREPRLDLDLSNTSQINLNEFRTRDHLEVRGTGFGTGSRGILFQQNKKTVDRSNGAAPVFVVRSSTTRFIAPILGILFTLAVAGGGWWYANKKSLRSLTDLIGKPNPVSQVSLAPEQEAPTPEAMPVLEPIQPTSATIDPEPVAKAEPVAEPEPPKGTTELASVQPVNQTYTVVIEAIPRPARVYIDGKDTGAYTPVRRQLPSNKEVRIGLSSDGYKYFEKIEKISRDGLVLKATLEPLPKMGYLSISAFNGGLDPVVYINDQRINQKLPIRFYGVPANVSVKVRITNPFAQVSGETTVKVGAGERKNVKIILESEIKN
jgi:eukaryotic-like serine/threonine-protein kinase